MLREVFIAAKRTLDENSVIYVRTDGRSFTQLTTQAVLSELWPSYRQFARHETPMQSQTKLFGHKSDKPGETDFSLLPPGQVAPLGFAPAASITAAEGVGPIVACARAA